MAITKLENMVNPQVMADMISASLPAALKFAPLAKIDNTLKESAGDTITIAKFNYVGAADELVEGVPMDTRLLTTTSGNVTVKEVGIAIELSKQAMNAGYGDAVEEAVKQSTISIADKVDTDCMNALLSTTKVHDVSTESISYGAIVDAVDKFQEDDDEPKVLFIHPTLKATLRKDPDFIRASEMGDKVFMTGVIGEVAGCQVVASRKIPVAEGVYSCVIAKQDALAIYVKQDVELEQDKDILNRSLVLAGTQDYVATLVNESKAVKLLCTK